MGARKSREVPADLARALQRFLQWRNGRQGKSRIPDSLWKVAVQLAQEHGVSRIASVLKLDYYALKKRLSAAEPVASAGPTFVELPVSPPAATSQCVIELNDGAGESMRVSLQGYPASDLAELGRTFWETQQCCKSLRK